MQQLESRWSEILLPEKVAEQVSEWRSPRNKLRQLINRHPEVVTGLDAAEEVLCLQFLAQGGIHRGEADAMAVALNRGLALIIDESQKKARGKAENHGITCLNSQDFVGGSV